MDSAPNSPVKDRQTVPPVEERLNTLLKPEICQIIQKDRLDNVFVVTGHFDLKAKEV